MWHIFVLGLILMLNGSESRAVNISNKWTLPHEGFNVFYRFFRDKISWFEADAVCQFHHANLVTVDNSLQFDATRNFLKLLNVTQPVWIGLMRPQNTKTFTWANSKPLASSSGYWAESLPLMDSPLCAVVDPVRDFRWHALRCGGPETASFLCEINVPKWVKECIPTDVSSLTIQYIADTASVAILKDCGTEETIQHMCKSRQDLEEIIKRLACKNQPELNIKRDSTYSKSLEFIRNISSDNNEDNNINTQPQKFGTEKPAQKNQVQKLIEQFNIEEIMHADQPQPQLESHVNEEFFKMSKKPDKKAKSIEKKNEMIRKNKNRRAKAKNVSMGDMMMGDEPLPVTDESLKPLPHIKKSLSQDLKHDYDQLTTPSIKAFKSTTEQDKKILVTEMTGLTTTPIIGSMSAAIENKVGNVMHPVHPQQAHDGSTVGTMSEEEMKHSVNRETTSDSHFIPPMLLVKSHYTSTKSHLDEQDSAITSGDKTEIITQSTESIFDKTKLPSSFDSEHHTTNAFNTSIQTTISDSITKDVTILSTTDSVTTNKDEPISSAITPTFNDHQIVEIKFTDPDKLAVFSITTRPAPTEINTNTMKLNENSGLFQHQEYEHEKQTNLEDHQQNELPTTITTSEVNHSQEEKSDEGKKVHNKTINKFSNEENFQPYKPNRKRILTKPETTTYLKKILG